MASFRHAIEFGVFVDDPGGGPEGRSMRAFDAAREFGVRAANERDPRTRDRLEQNARELSAAVKGMLPEDLRRYFGETVNVRSRSQTERWLDEEKLREDGYKPHRPEPPRPGPPVAELKPGSIQERPEPVEEDEDEDEIEQFDLFR